MLEGAQRPHLAVAGRLEETERPGPHHAVEELVELAAERRESAGRQGLGHVLPGLGPRQAKRLSAAGIRSLAELAKTKRKLKGLDKPDKKGLVIAPDKLASWVTAAQAAAPG